jgi:hypothetical protein
MTTSATTRSTSSTADQLWDVGDYVTKRRYCTPADIQTYLDGIEVPGLQHFLLVTFSGSLILRSLCFAKGSRSDLSKTTRAFFRNAHTTFEPMPHTVSKPLFSSLSRRPPLLPLSKASSNKALRTLVAATGFTDLQAAPGSAEGTLWAVAVAGFQAHIKVDVSLAGYLQTVFLMLNASTVASVHRDQLVVRRVEQVLDSPLSDTPSAMGRRDLEATAIQRLLELAADVTRSGGAAFFEAGPNRNRLGGQRHSLRADVEPFKTTTRRLKAYRPSVAFHCYEQRRTIVAHFERGASAAETPSVRPTWRTARHSPKAESFYEVAIPVPSDFLELGAPLLGVLSVIHMASETDDFFGSYEFALLRNVALRLSILVSQERRRRFTGALQTLASARHSLHVRLSSRGFSVLKEIPPPPGLEVVPPDLAPALPSVNAALRVLAANTLSHSATIRLISTDGSRGSFAGRRLYRCLAHPSSELDREPLHIRIEDDSSLHAWVARNGAQCYINNVDALSSYKRYAGLRP